MPSRGVASSVADAQSALSSRLAGSAASAPSVLRRGYETGSTHRRLGVSAGAFVNDNIGADVTSHMATEPSPLSILSDDEQLLRANVRAFAEAEIRPLVREMDENAEIPRALIDKLVDLGVMAVEIPDVFGGAGGHFFLSIITVEELSRVDPAIAVLVDVQNTLVINALLRWGNDDVKERFLPRLAGGAVGAYALSEANSGSDAFAMAARAVSDGDEYILSGRKLWITNAHEADLFIVFANADPAAGYRGITAFVVRA